MVAKNNKPYYMVAKLGYNSEFLHCRGLTDIQFASDLYFWFTSINGAFQFQDESAAKYAADLWGGTHILTINEHLPKKEQVKEKM